MNILSNKLFSALARPLVLDISSSSGNYPSDASIAVLESDGSVRMIGSCHRQIYYRSSTIPPADERNPDWIISAALGNKVHDLIQNLIDEHGYRMGLQRIKAEHKFYDPRTAVSGRSDQLLWDKDADEPIGVEIKSVGDWKASQVINKPAEEHVLQSMIYLDYYSTAIPTGQKRPTRWYILYVARSESWNLKSRKHGSPFTNIWDFYITLNDKGNPVIHSSLGVETWDYISIDAIHKRFAKIKQEVAAGVIPDRDYTLSYSEPTISALFTKGKLNKTDSAIVEKWMAAGAKPGTLKLNLGDFECKACAWKNHCWNLPAGTSNSPYDLPANKQKEQQVSIDKPIL